VNPESGFDSLGTIPDSVEDNGKKKTDRIDLKV